MRLPDRAGSAGCSSRRRRSSGAGGTPAVEGRGDVAELPPEARAHVQRVVVDHAVSSCENVGGFGTCGSCDSGGVAEPAVQFDHPGVEPDYDVGVGEQLGTSECPGTHLVGRDRARLLGGVSRRADAPPADSDVVEIAGWVPRATLCLETAAARHGLIDTIQPSTLPSRVPTPDLPSGRPAVSTSSTHVRSTWVVRPSPSSASSWVAGERAWN